MSPFLQQFNFSYLLYLKKILQLWKEQQKVFFFLCWLAISSKSNKSISHICRTSKLKLVCININYHFTSYTAICNKIIFLSIHLLLSVWMSCLISFVQPLLSCEEWEGSEQWEMEIYVSSGRLRNHVRQAFERYSSVLDRSFIGLRYLNGLKTFTVSLHTLYD